MKIKLFQIQRELLSSHVRRSSEASELTKKALTAVAVSCVMRSQFHPSYSTLTNRSESLQVKIV